MFKRFFLLGLFSGELIFGRAYYWKEFSVSKWVGLDNKTADSNSPWAYIWEGLLSEGYLRLRFGGFIFGRLIFGRAYHLLLLLLNFFFFWGGGYYRNFNKGIPFLSKMVYKRCPPPSYGLSSLFLSLLFRVLWNSPAKRLLATML